MTKKLVFNKLPINFKISSVFTFCYYILYFTLLHKSELADYYPVFVALPFVCTHLKYNLIKDSHAIRRNIKLVLYLYKVMFDAMKY
jgi:hypothetical protein